mgnify:CR=1 FL=1
MLETSRSGSRFYCPECGALFRAPRADAGTAIPCLRCGLPVRVPTEVHPVESDACDAPLISPSAAQAATNGLRLLLISLGLGFTAFLVALLIKLVWATLEGPAAMLGRSPGPMARTAAVGQAVSLGLLAVAAWLRWVGYGRCQIAADAVRAGNWLSMARLGVVLGMAGQAMAAYPAMTGLPVEATPMTLQAVAQMGDVGRVAGALLEMTVLLVWLRFLTEAGRTDALPKIRRYAILVGTSVALMLIIASFVGLAAALTLGRATHRPVGSTEPVPKLDLSLVPPAGWIVLGMLAAVMCILVTLLTVQYGRILAATYSTMNRYPGPASESRRNVSDW